MLYRRNLYLNARKTLNKTQLVKLIELRFEDFVLLDDYRQKYCDSVRITCNSIEVNPVAKKMFDSKASSKNIQIWKCLKSTVDRLEVRMIALFGSNTIS